MSLYKQMVIFMTLCILCVSAIIMISVLGYDKNAVENQLHANAKNSASFLGLTIGKNVNLNDTTTIDEVLSAMLDNGFYKSITVLDVDNKIISSASHESIANVPFWFLSFTGTKNLTASADIMKGWLNRGSVKVVVDDNYVTNTLWKSFKGIVYIFLISTFFALIFLCLLLRYLLNPLKKLDKQARAIDENKFIIVKETTATTEFASVTNAMNKSVRKLKGIFAKEIDVFRKYNRLLYTDEELKIGNRKFMMLKLEYYLKHSFGSFMFIEIENRSEVKNSLGYISFASFITFMINSCDDAFGNNKEFIVAKLNEETLGVLLPYQEHKDIKDRVDEFYWEVNSYIKYGKIDKECKINLVIGVANYMKNEHVSGLLIRTNESLKEANEQEDKKISYIHIGDEFKHENKTLFSLALVQSGIIDFDKMGVLHTQTRQYDLIEYLPKFSLSNEKDSYTRELVMGISNVSSKIKIQTNILKELFLQMEKSSVKQHVSIKLVKEFAVDRKSIDWLVGQLQTQFNDGKIKFYFECLNRDIHAKRKDFEYLVDTVRANGHEFAVESYAFENNNFEYLKILHPAYIKISKSYILQDLSNISKDILENITVALGSKLIIKDVDEIQDLLKLETLKVSYMQGKYLKEIKT